MLSHLDMIAGRFEQSLATATILKRLISATTIQLFNDTIVFPQVTRTLTFAGTRLTDTI